MDIKSYKKDGKTYYKFQIRLGQSVTRRQGFKTKQEAIFAYTSLLEEYSDIKYRRVKYEGLYSEWLAYYKTTVKESVYNKCKRDFTNHVLPFFKGKYVEKITPDECQDFAMYLIKLVKGKYIFNQAKRVVEYGVKLKYIKSNPFNNVVLPKFKEKKKLVNFLSVEEVNILLNYFKYDLYWYCLFRILIYAGLRRGEVLALNWSDINFKNKTITIDKNLTLGEDYIPYIEKPKTKNSIRNLVIDDITIKYLKRYKLTTANNIVFPSVKGNYTRLSNIQDKLNKAIKDTGIKQIRVHDLRHTHASLLFDSGASIATVKERLGHSDIKTTMNIYVHVTESSREKSLNDFVNYMNQHKVI